jgi:hypothetical protein
MTSPSSALNFQRVRVVMQFEWGASLECADLSALYRAL